jgi:hypothetical protein
MGRRLPIITAILALLLLIPAPAGAALVDEQRQGQNLIAQLQAGTKSCNDLAADDLDHMGEYVMFRALGSTALHQEMNDRMTLMMGDQAETRMHQLLGGRYAGCSRSGLGRAGAGSMMAGGGMMGGGYPNSGWGSMMGSGDWNWMMGGTWQHMSPSQWQAIQRRLLGTTTVNNHTGWSPLAIIGVTLAGVMVALLAIVAITRGRRFRRPPTPAQNS